MDAAAPGLRDGLVYVCVEGGGEFAKVGWTSSLEHATGRLQNLRTGNPRSLEMRIVGPGGPSAEARLHAACATQRVRGEWFRIEGPVVELVAGSTPLPERDAPEMRNHRAPGRPPAARRAAMQWLERELRDGPVAAGAVFAAAEAAGHSAKTTRRAAAELGVLRVPPRGGCRCCWRLP